MRKAAMVETLCLILCLAVGSGLCRGQGAVLAVSGGLAGWDPLDPELLREIDDARNGDRWLLLSDPQHPGGPARLVLATRFAGRAASGPTAAAAPEVASALAAGRPLSAPMIRAGDPVVVEENSSLIEARLEAVALAPAQAGSLFNARLRLGGRVVRATALSPGHARLEALVPEVLVPEAVVPGAVVKGAR